MIVHGRVASFDERRGDGVVVSGDGERFHFHCVDIADGTRTIAEGDAVIAERTVGHLGRDEVVNVIKAASA